MNIRNAVFAAIVASSLAASPSAAQDLSGTWELSVPGGRGAQTMALDLTQDGSALTGTITMTMGGRRGGGGGGQAREIEISDGSVEGSSFTFTMTVEFNGNGFSQVFSGTFEGDTMTGEIQGDGGGRGRGGRGGAGPREFTGTRGS